MLTDEQVAEIVETTYPCEWETDYDPCNPTCALCLKRSTCALLTDRAELVAEAEKLWEAYWRARACGSVETCNAECWDCMFPPHDDDQEATR